MTPVATTTHDESSQAVVRVLIVDDHAAVRSGLRAILEANERVTVVGEAANGQVAMRQALALRPDVVVMDIRMPGTDGITATREITATTGARVLILTSFEIDEYLFEALRAGAVGYLLKSASAPELQEAVRAVHAGEAMLSPQVTRTLIATFAADTSATAASPPAGLSDLTKREREVLDCLGEGMSNRQVALHLAIEETTVKTHVARVLRKIGAQSRLQAAIVAKHLR